MEIKEKTMEDQKVAIMNYKGALKDMDVLVSKLTGWVEVEEIETAGDLFAIFYNNPRTAKENEVVY
ncbi:MAG: AraC family transcriptional regulator, partial [Methanobrevibacter sp.]|nr:AraC family transcriptional regulator [Methanobrevibacter sp.]